MAELQNIFFWSFSAAMDFEECRRKRYWRKYGSWNGWRSDAPDLARRAWRLGKMDNRYTLQGRAVETAVLWLIEEHRAGRSSTADAAYEASARPFLNQAWQQSRKGDWKTDPLRHCCLHEHYYPAFHQDSSKEWVEQVRTHILQCLGHFIDDVLPRIGHVRAEDELRIEDPRKESFPLEDITIYAVPDFAYREGDLLHIHDWKSGAPRPEHRLQIGVYAWWAHVKHGIDPEQIRVFIEYLQAGQVVMEPMTAEWMQEILSDIGESVADMTDYLREGDRAKNLPLPQEEWDLTTNRSVCQRCCYYELCRPELEG